MKRSHFLWVGLIALLGNNLLAYDEVATSQDAQQPTVVSSDAPSVTEKAPPSPAERVTELNTQVTEQKTIVQLITEQPKNDWDALLAAALESNLVSNADLLFAMNHYMYAKNDQAKTLVENILSAFLNNESKHDDVVSFLASAEMAIGNDAYLAESRGFDHSRKVNCIGYFAEQGYMHVVELLINALSVNDIAAYLFAPNGFSYKKYAGSEGRIVKTHNFTDATMSLFAWWNRDDSKFIKSAKSNPYYVQALKIVATKLMSDNGLVEKLPYELGCVFGLLYKQDQITYDELVTLLYKVEHHPLNQ